MRRHPVEPPTPPAELLDYRAWCAKHNRRAYCEAGGPPAMAAAMESWAAWERERDAWSAVNGVEALDVRDDQPWDGIS